MGAVETIDLKACAGTDQQVFDVEFVPTDFTVSEAVEVMVNDLGLPRKDPQGRPQSYAAFLGREGRKLNPTEFVGDALKTDDFVELEPHVNAG